MKIKVCTRCKKRKRIDSFYKRDNINNNNKTYYKSECKECSKARSREWVKKNPERFRKYQNEWHLKNHHEAKKSV